MSPLVYLANFGHGHSGRARWALQVDGSSLLTAFTEAVIASGALPFSTQSISAPSASNFSNVTPPPQWVSPGSANRRANVSALPCTLVFSFSYQRMVSLIENTGSAWP